MPGPLLHVGAVVVCSHGTGQAQPAVPNLRVSVSGQLTATMPVPWVVAGCLNPAPCATAQWLVAATRVTSNGQPLVLFDSQAVAAPTGTPLRPVFAQIRATAM